MKKQGRRYPASVIRKAVAMRRSGQKVNVIAHELNIPADAVYRWMRQKKVKAKATYTPKVEKDNLADITGLRKENMQLRAAIMKLLGIQTE